MQIDQAQLRIWCRNCVAQASTKIKETCSASAWLGVPSIRLYAGQGQRIAMVPAMQQRRH
jgi:ribosomal protein L37E